jgi:hypothetical protein
MKMLIDPSLIEYGYVEKMDLISQLLSRMFYPDALPDDHCCPPSLSTAKLR